MFVLLTILGISFLICIHEFGHFICARLAGVKVHVFSIGFGQRLWGFQRGGTDYRLSLLPLGGYVQVAGDNPVADRRTLRPDDLHAKGFLARTLFYSGGVVMNLLFALIVFPLVFYAGIDFEAPVLGRVNAGGAAWEAGLQAGDRIFSVEGKEVYSYNNITVEVALASASRGVRVVYERDGTTYKCTVHPRYSTTRGIRTMGIGPPAAPGPFSLDVPPELAAHETGLRTGDVLLAIDDQPIETIEDWDDWSREVSQQLNIGGTSAVSLTVRRAGTDGPTEQDPEFVFDVPLRPRPDGPLRIGVNATSRRVLGLRQDDANLRALDLRRGDRILFVNGQPFSGGELDLSGASETVELTVDRPEQDETVVLRTVVPSDQRSELAANIALGPDPDEVRILPQPGSAAEIAGLRRGDQIKSVNGTLVADWAELQQAVAVAGEDSITFHVLRPEGFETIEVTPQRVAMVGFEPRPVLLTVPYRKEEFGAALEAGVIASIDLVKRVYVTLKGLFTGDVSTRNLGGIITISRVSYSEAQRGMSRLFFFLALLSINLAVINVLPIPVLDGGHLMFLLIERIKGSPVSSAVHNYSTILGLVFVLALLVYVTYNDILRLIT